MFVLLKMPTNYNGVIMNKKIVIYMSRLKYGGMEKALIDFLNMSKITENNDVTLYLGYALNKNLLNELPSKLKCKLLTKKWNLLGKIEAGVKLCFLKFKLMLKRNSYDTSICYTNHQKIFSDLARLSSKNNILFVHSDVARYNDVEKEKMKNKIKYNQFSTIICNSKKSALSLQNLYDEKLNIKIIPNYVNGDIILKKSKEKINDFSFEKNMFYFINIANHVEEFKNISSIIKACNELKEKYKFKLLLIGEGKDTNYYKELINEFGLNDVVFLLGSKKNPYPYLKNSNCLIFSSKYEGYGMVLDEARVLNIPIISSNCGAGKEIVTHDNGFVYEKEEALVKYMEKMLTNPIKINKTFDYQKFNQEITEKINEIL